MTDIVVRLPRPIAIFLLIFSVPFFVLLTFVCVFVALSMHTSAETYPIWRMVACYAIFSATVVFSCASILFIFRYGKESLFTTFRFVEQGIYIENSRYHALMLSWSDVESASYSRSLKIVVLRSRKLAVPIAISQWKNFPEAVELLKERIGERWVEKWL
jgi:hypothetical protein